MARFDGKVAIVTGGASGIGRAAVLRLAAEGARVYALDVNEAGLAETCELASGGEVQTGVHDVATQAGCAAAVGAAVGAFGRLDVLANVAGIVRFTHVTDMTEDQWNLVMGVNLSGPFFMSQAAIPHLLESEGNIVNVASNAGLMGQAYTVAYCASKAGLVNMTRAMAMEYVKKKIRINCVCPAGTATNLVASADFPDGIDGSLMKRYSGFRGFTTPEEIVNVIAFMASDEASAVHGAVWEADQAVSAG